MNSILYYLKACYDPDFWVGQTGSDSQHVRSEIMGTKTKEYLDKMMLDICKDHFWCMKRLIRSFQISCALGDHKNGIVTMFIPKEMLTLSREIQKVVIHGFIDELALSNPTKSVTWMRCEDDTLRITFDPKQVVEYFEGLEEVPMKLVDSQQKV